MKDLSGNVMDIDTKTFVGMKSDTLTVDNSSPFTVKSVTAISSTTVEVVFNHQVEKASAENSSNYTINTRYTSLETITITGAALDSSEQR